MSTDFTTKLVLVQELAKSLDLAVSGTSEHLKVTEDEVAVAEVGGMRSLLPSSLFLAFVFRPLVMSCESLCRLSLGR